MERRYDEAKKEFKNENEDNKNRLVYAYFGLAIYYGQCLEETFSIMLWTDRIVKKKVNSNKEINEIIDSIENSKKTMGNFINEIKQSYTFTESITDQLNSILETRNYLAHKYFKIHIEKFYSEIGMLEMIEYFCKFIDDAKSLDEQLKSYYNDYLIRFGITEERIQELMIEMEEQNNKMKQ